MEDIETGNMTVATNGEVDEDDEVNLIANLKQLRTDASNLYGVKHVMDVPGYKGLMAVEYGYISSEVTEKIARDVRRETKNNNGAGMNLLSSIDTLVAASRNVLIRKAATGDWLLPDGEYAPGVRPIRKDHTVNFRTTELATILDYDAKDGREVVLGLYGSEHSIIEANVFLSRWMTDKTRTADEDFLA
jgi:hypothetical protein